MDGPGAVAILQNPAVSPCYPLGCSIYGSLHAVFTGGLQRMSGVSPKQVSVGIPPGVPPAPSPEASFYRVVMALPDGWRGEQREGRRASSRVGSLPWYSCTWHHIRTSTSNVFIADHFNYGSDANALFKANDGL